jgi:hypothetical protein
MFTILRWVQDIYEQNLLAPAVSGSAQILVEVDLFQHPRRLAHGTAITFQRLLMLVGAS